MSSIQLNEIYRSVQGETSLAGFPTTFIRLSGCNLRCTWCDTTYSFGKGIKKSLFELVADVQKFGCPYVCITGGEPLLQKSVYLLMTTLCNEGYKVSIETGGSLSTNEIDERVVTILDIKCPGSGMSDRNHFENVRTLKNHDEVKFVIKDQADYEWSQKICMQYNLYTRKNVPLFSPVHGVLDPKELIEWILNDKLPVRLNLQIHKYIWTPETMGV